MSSSDTGDLLDLYRKEARAAGEEFAALDVLTLAASENAAVAEAFGTLARLDAAHAFDLHQAHAEARRDLVLCAARLERLERARAAGAHRYSGLCECEHSGFRHARMLTEDGRIPCDEAGCRCDDLAFVGG